MLLQSKYYALLLIYGFLGSLILFVMKNNFNLFSQPILISGIIGAFIFPIAIIFPLIIVVPFTKRFYDWVKGGVQYGLVGPIGRKKSRFLLLNFVMSTFFGAILYTQPSILLGNVLPAELYAQIPNFVFKILSKGDPYLLYLLQFGIPLISSLIIPLYRLTHTSEIRKLRSLYEDEKKNKTQINDTLNNSNSFANSLFIFAIFGIFTYYLTFISVSLTDFDQIRKFLIDTLWIFSILDAIVIWFVMGIIEKYYEKSY